MSAIRPVPPITPLSVKTRATKRDLEVVEVDNWVFECSVTSEAPSPLVGKCKYPKLSKEVINFQRFRYLLTSTMSDSIKFLVWEI